MDRGNKENRSLVIRKALKEKAYSYLLLPSVFASFFKAENQSQTSGQDR